jgi:hypothetical protein
MSKQMSKSIMEYAPNEIYFANQYPINYKHNILYHFTEYHKQILKIVARLEDNYRLAKNLYCDIILQDCSECGFDFRQYEGSNFDDILQAITRLTRTILSKSFTNFWTSVYYDPHEKTTHLKIAIHQLLSSPPDLENYVFYSNPTTAIIPVKVEKTDILKDSEPKEEPFHQKPLPIDPICNLLENFLDDPIDLTAEQGALLYDLVKNGKHTVYGPTIKKEKICDESN